MQVVCDVLVFSPGCGYSVLHRVALWSTLRCVQFSAGLGGMCIHLGVAVTDSVSKQAVNFLSDSFFLRLVCLCGFCVRQLIWARAGLVRSLTQRTWLTLGLCNKGAASSAQVHASLPSKV